MSHVHSRPHSISCYSYVHVQTIIACINITLFGSSRRSCQGQSSADLSSLLNVHLLCCAIGRKAAAQCYTMRTGRNCVNDKCQHSHYAQCVREVGDRLHGIT
jgi:hypothetical protein